MSIITTDFPSTLSTTAGQTPATPVHGPRLAGAWRRVGILAWAVLFLACLAALIMSVAYADLWYRTPYTSIQTISADTDPAAIEATIRPFQEAINGLGLTLDLYSHYFTVLRLLAGLPYFILSVLIIRRRSDRLMAVLFAMVLCLLGAAGTWFTPLWAWIPETYPWHPALSKLLSALLFCCIAILYTFPDGRFVPRWTRWLAVLVVPFALATNFAPTGSMLNPYNWPGPLSSIPNPFFLGCGVFAIVYRYRHYADAVQKQQLKWFVAGAVLIILSWFVDFAVWQLYPTLTGGEYLIQPGQSAVLWELFQDTAWYIAQIVFAVCIAISVFRYRLWDIDLVINRVLVFGSLTALTMLVYLATVTALGSLFEGLADRWAFFLATGLVAILFEPLRQRLQRLVNRLMYGERDDPYGVLTRLSSALETAPTPQEVLPALVAHIAQALKIPYVDIRLEQDEHDQAQVAASYGKPQDELISFPVVYQEEGIGSLQLARRAPGEEFSTADRRLIENIARQAGPAAQSVRLHAQLLRSRAQIVSEREEERLRIRRDLHDELGPILASQGLRLAAARQLIRSAPEKAEGLVDEVAQQSQTTVNEIRRLVHGLRPPALDQLGLVDAIRDLISQSGQEYNQHGMAVEINASPNPLPKLPAAVEVNAYRIVLEAIANVTRHAQAGQCTVKFQVRDDGENSLNPAALLIQINDDGVGLQGRYREGVGLRSMRQRAEEIGGKFTIEPAQPHGTALTAWLPLSL